MWFGFSLASLLLIGGTPGEESLEAMPKADGAAKAWLQKKLEPDAIWWHDPDDAQGKERLLGYLRAAEKSRAVNVGPILARNIGYDDVNPRDTAAALFPDRGYPSYRVLKSFGIDSVNPILRELKNFDVDDPIPITKSFKDLKTQEEYRNYKEQLAREQTRMEMGLKRSLLVECLVEIYNGGDFGRPLAYRRIELEAAKATGKEKERLLRALKASFPKGAQLDKSPPS